MSFQPSQIVCLEYSSWRLYAEVIQAIEVKQTCWLRPVMVVEGETLANQTHLFELSFRLYDLRQDSDLLLPALLLRPALDVEVIPLLTHLYQADRLTEDSKTVGGECFQLRQLIQQICLAHPEMFQPASF